jgi:shikimate dehydrogenase
VSLTGNSKVAGVIGWPVSHSLSPRLHGYWLQLHGIDGAYIPLPVAPENVEAAVRALPVLGFQGANVTVPHKEAVFRAVDQTDEMARRLGAVNTIVVTADGAIEGRNTDGRGFLESLRAAETGWRPERGPAVILGAGGAARAIVAALLAAGVPEVRLLNRTAARADELAGQIGDAGQGALDVVPWEQRNDALGGAALLVNTTTLGMVGNPPLSIALNDLPPAATVLDIVYKPLETDLLAAARGRGNPAVDGLGMLLHQARPSFAAWFGVEPHVTAELRQHVLTGDDGAST